MEEWQLGRQDQLWQVQVSVPLVGAGPREEEGERLVGAAAVVGEQAAVSSRTYYYCHRCLTGYRLWRGRGWRSRRR